MDIIKSIKIKGLPVREIIENPSKFKDNPEVIGTVLDGLKVLNRQLYEHKIRLEGVLTSEMECHKATKMPIVGFDGRETTIILKNGSMTLNCKDAEAESLIKSHNFNPLSLGAYVYKVKSWKELKELRKQGGAIQELIDDLYKPGKKKIEIK